ncbi:cytochrome b-c1 complex subunit Rieske-4, mitochondrial [Selaginella moellendorffii]|nr:cytochrome b-c1 complex subunit Rieske-4, mitochondrial [Selaginella moellendorffii]|eukprot:XP_002969387.2 cytochrome b-c1 complex subunit Rieske-4, mitochondrial [Selaginella moellendorffii]
MASSLIRDLGRKLAPRIASAAAGSTSSFHTCSSGLSRGAAWSASNAMANWDWEKQEKSSWGSCATPWSYSTTRGCALTRGSEALTRGGEDSSPFLTALRNPTANIVYDESVVERYPPGDPDRAAYIYFVATGTRFVYAAAIRVFILRLIMTMSASADVMALSSLEVDLSNIIEGSTITVKWRGKPVFIRRRTPDEVATANSVPVNSLRDPQQDAERVVNPEWLIVIGVCTHLGCVPLPNAGDYGGWFCPCHGSHYDVSGRVRKGPAPLNLEVPEYKFISDTTVLIG